MFCKSLQPLLASHANEREELEKIDNDFAQVMQIKMIQMWTSKLGLKRFNADLVNELIRLMIDTSVDYTIFFRELSHIPDDITPLQKSFYTQTKENPIILKQWSAWLEKWKNLLDLDTQSPQQLSQKMKQINPKYTLREWFLVPAYKAAQNGDYSLIHELQAVMTHPYTEQSSETEHKYYRKKPDEFFEIAGISHISCSS
jgi:uncharacterized protein YdiU (UPF0061 family)